VIAYRAMLDVPRETVLFTAACWPRSGAAAGPEPV
jgi:hypothetical protein